MNKFRIREELPAPGATPVEHLRHVLAAHEYTKGDDMAVQATSGIYDEGNTGLTYADLREILAMLETRS